MASDTYQKQWSVPATPETRQAAVRFSLAVGNPNTKIDSSKEIVEKIGNCTKFIQGKKIFLCFYSKKKIQSSSFVDDGNPGLFIGAHK